MSEYLRLGEQVAAARRAGALDAVEDRIAASFGSIGSARRMALEKQLRLLTEPAALKARAALRERAEGEIRPPWSQEIVRPTIREFDPHELPDLEPVSVPSRTRIERAAAWATVLGFPLGLLALAVGVAGTLRAFGIV